MSANQPNERLYEKLLPQNVEAEAGVLGSILIDPDALVTVTGIVRPDDFYREAHATVYRAALDLYEAGTPVDLLTLIDELGRTGKLEDAGGASAISSLANQVPTSANAEYYAQLVQRAAVLRRLINAAGKIAGIAYNEPDADVALDQAEKLIFAVARDFSGRMTQARSMAEIMTELTDNLGALTAQGASRGVGAGVASGFGDLDKLLGGFQKSDLIIVAGRPGSGKSSLANSIAENVALRGGRTRIYSLEMSALQVGQRFLSMASGLPLQRLRIGPLSDSDIDTILSTAGGVVAPYPVVVDDTPGLSLSDLRARARRAMLEEPFDLLMVDYLQLMSSGASASGGRPENRVQEVSAISRGLKELARELNVPVIALSQLSRAVEAREDKRPLLSDLRESGSLEQDADVVLFIYREALYNQESDRRNIADLLIAKHRNGPTGTVSLYFKGDETRFRDLSLRQPEPADLGWDDAN